MERKTIDGYTIYREKEITDNFKIMVAYRSIKGTDEEEWACWYEDASGNRKGWCSSLEPQHIFDKYHERFYRNK